MDEFAFPQFNEPTPLDDGRAWTARFESFDQRNDNVYYTIRILVDGKVTSTFIGRVSYVGDTQDEAQIRESFTFFLARIAASGQTNTDYTGSPFAAQ